MKNADGGFFLVWRSITFLLTFLGFMALASTGELHPVVNAVFVTFWVAAFFTFRRPPFWRDWMGSALLWLALAVIALIAVRGKFSCILYLMLFLAIFKCFTLRAPNDHLHALTMAFFMFLACSIITSSAFYLVFLFFFIILLMLDMVCLTIAREGGRSHAGFGAGLDNRPPGAAGIQGLPGLWRRLILSSLAAGTVVLVMTIVIFLLLPHYSANRLPNPWVKPIEDQVRLTGYSDDLSFSNLRQLKPDDSEVMKVFPAWDDGVKRPFPPNLRLRGQALDQYDEARWVACQRGPVKESSLWAKINFPAVAAARGPVLNLNIRNQNVMAVRRLFGASMPIQFQLDDRSRQSRRPGGRPELLQYYRLRLDWNIQSVQLIPTANWGSSSLATINYLASSRLADEAMPLLRSLLRARIGGDSEQAPEGLNLRPDPELRLSAEEKALNTFLPPTKLTRTLGRISRQFATGADVPEKILSLMNWLYSNFEYSLTPESAFGQHPLETFLTRSHKGHCEYFASSFVLLLRAQGIPARVATGFYTSDLHTEGERTYYRVVQSDAHAWAEVWMDGFGWLTLDPTPPDWRGRTTRMREGMAFSERAAGWIKSVWQKYVLDYSEFQQARLVQWIRENSLARSIAFTWSVVVETVKNLLLPGAGDRPPSTREIYNRLILVSLALALALIWLTRFVACARRRGLAGVSRSSVAFMNQLIQRLDTLGWKRPPSQTPAEWLGEIDQKTEGRWQLAWVVDLYHRCRFAAEAPTSEDEARLRDIFRQLHP